MYVPPQFCIDTDTHWSRRNRFFLTPWLSVDILRLAMNIDTEAKVEEFRTVLEADLSSVESEFARVQSDLDRLEQERDKLLRLIKEVNMWLSSSKDDGGHSHIVETTPPNVEDEESPTSLQGESPPATNGLPENATRRQIVLRIVPDFHGETFTAGDIRHRFVQDYLEEEPPNFPQAINNLLQRMADKGEITSLGRKGDKPGDPHIYREIKNQEESLLEP